MTEFFISFQQKKLCTHDGIFHFRFPQTRFPKLFFIDFSIMGIYGDFFLNFQGNRFLKDFCQFLESLKEMGNFPFQLKPILRRWLIP